MEKKKVVLIGICSMLFLSTGCGRNYGGTFRGTATITMLGQAAVPVPVTVNLNNNGNVVTGTITSTVGTLNITGGSAAGNNISGMTGTWTSANTATTPTGTMPQTMVYPNTACNNVTLQGNMSFSNGDNSLNANLNSINSGGYNQYPNTQYPNQYPTQYPNQYPNTQYPNMNGGCSVQVNVTANRSN